MPRSTKKAAKLSLQEFTPYKLAVVANRLSQSIGSLFEKRYGIHIPEWRILMALHSCGPLAPSEVVEHTSMDKVRVSRAQRRLVELALVAVRDDPRDGRRLLLFLTRKGAGMCAAIIPAARETEAWFLSVLPARERQALDRALSRLLARSREQAAIPLIASVRRSREGQDRGAKPETTIKELKNAGRKY